MKFRRMRGARAFNSHCSRRVFLQAGAVALAGMSEMSASKPAAAATKASADAVILILLSGGPSQLDTWDPKPLAPSSVRGPFRPISTNVVGMQISESFSLMARHADKFAVVRSVYHDQAPVHEIGTAILRGGSSDPVIEARSDNQFAHSCKDAVTLVEAGVRMVTIEMFSSLYDRVTWDCHANEADLPTTLADYRRTVCPMFDRAYAGLLEDLTNRGLLKRTLVVCAGEFGRSPNINSRGGRDHWTGVWTALFAGGGVRGGQVIGSSDRHGAEPHDCPVNARQLSATMLHALGVSETARSPEMGEPIFELF